MAAGIRVASAPVIALMDGDLQNDASDIPAMMGQLLAEDLDMVAGRRMARQDHVLWRKFPSKIANRLIGWLTGVKLNDYGCSLKVFRASLAKELDLYGELHRFIPVLVSMRGGRFAQVPVRHHRRHAGSSKYGIDRTFRVISDLLLMIFFQRFLQRPMHLFGYMGLGLLGAGGLIEGYLLLLKLLGHSIGGRPLFYVGWMAILGGFQCLTTGLVAELVMRTYFASHQRFPYEWRRVMVRDAESWRSRMDS
jgi:glycosyltransferase involved in cell wall biosynthesis